MQPSDPLAGMAWVSPWAAREGATPAILGLMLLGHVVARGSLVATGKIG